MAEGRRKRTSNYLKPTIPYGGGALLLLHPRHLPRATMPNQKKKGKKKEKKGKKGKP